MKVPKAVKNEVQVKAMKEAHVRYYIIQTIAVTKRLVKKIYDAVALCEYLMWLDKNVALGKVDEISGLKYLSDLRLAQPKSKGLSFGGISAVGPNAAIIHYG